MRNRLLSILAIGVFATALGVVHARQENRQLYSELQRLNAERDALNVEWGRLLLEEGAWSQHRRVETTARSRLGMELPEASRVVTVRLRAEAK